MACSQRMGLATVAAMAVLAASTAYAQDPPPPQLYWQGTGVAGNLTDPNYTDGTLMNLTPSAADMVWFGGGGTGTLSGAGELQLYRLRIGHGETIGAGQGDVTVSGGAHLNLVGGMAGTANAGLIVGQNQRGSLTIDGATVTSARLIVIGSNTNNPNRNGTVNVTNGGSLIAADGNINLGIGGTGMQGHLNVNGTVEVNGPGADLNIGGNNTTSTMTLTSGSVFVNDVVEVGTSGSGANNKSSLTISGGTFTNGNAFFVGRGASTGATLNLNGGEVNVGGRFLMGGGTASGGVTNHTAGTLNAGIDLRVADVGSVGVTDMTYNFSGGVINSTAGGIIARQGTGRFIQTGGEANFFDRLSIGRLEGEANGANGLYRISGGTLNAGSGLLGSTALDISPSGTGELRVVGDDATVNLLGNFIVNSAETGDGTLAFELEVGDLLSTVMVSETATFAPGSKLVFDITNALPTQTSYNLLTAASIVLDPEVQFDGPLGWTTQVVSGGNGQILQAVGPLIEPEDNADFDNDGDVDGNDFLAWQRGLGGAPTKANGNANFDGAVNAQDYAIWASQFGSVSAASASSAVPEPAGLALLALGVALFAAPVRRATHSA